VTNYLRILWFNWRDIKNPDAGGAEVFTHEVMSRLAKKGYDMTLFTSRVSNLLQEEKIDGIKIVRRGAGKTRVYSKAKEFYNKNRSNYDFIIDEINTRPFLTPRFVKEKPILAVFHQLAREFWFYETFFPLNFIGYHYLERKWLSCYRNIPTVTVSNSSKEDLEALGFTRILMVPQGLSVTPLSKVPEKESSPTVAFIGRLKKAKLPHHAIQAFNLIKKEIPNSKMWIIGDGYMSEKLKKLNSRDVFFYGHIKDQLKFKMLGRAHIVLVPAIREGWGLVVTESNAMGTPAIAYNVPGLKDSVINKRTGVLVEKNCPRELASSAIALLEDKALLEKYSNDALTFSRQFNWDKTANAFENIIRHTYR
jgi:glycosyltransferase involved in cell wall biosynthesis